MMPLIWLLYAVNINQSDDSLTPIEGLFNLKTKVAGNMLQKLVNYHIKAVTVISREIIQKED